MGTQDEPLDERAKATKLLVQLANTMGDERGKPFGWQKTVARELDVSESLLSKYINGERDRASWDTLRAADKASARFHEMAGHLLGTAPRRGPRADDRFGGGAAEPRVEYSPSEHGPNATALRLELRVRDHFDDAGRPLSQDERAKVRARAQGMAGRYGDDDAFRDLVDLVEAWRSRGEKPPASTAEQRGLQDARAVDALERELDEVAGVQVHPGVKPPKGVKPEAPAKPERPTRPGRKR